MNGVIVLSKNNSNEGSISSAATTPGALSTFDEEGLLVPFFVSQKNQGKWASLAKKCKIPLGQIPWAILSTSILQLIFHIFSDKTLQRHLRFEPKKQKEVWRFFSYMLVHDDWYHLVLNILMQCLFAFFVEKKQGKCPVLAVYILGGGTGVLGASCVHPDLVIGASAGVYALLISMIADIALNFEVIKYKMSRIACIGIIVLSDIIYNVVHFCSRDEPLISWGAHIVGGATGFLVGLVIFKRSNEPLSKRRNKILFWAALIFYICLLISLVTLSLQIKKCTPANSFKKYVYFC
ncbi:unnamed protein product [Brassicogethes aeneus]|uniref:Peptidase S54 rhomboid domain-containing protein n=1 Tax=Brassicogethes aeneus TaxID=1431903 RepID=A0A9P0B622_BRAAE|nr:unnamed protein product [Brassicogethes aeneus]